MSQIHSLSVRVLVVSLTLIPATTYAGRIPVRPIPVPTPYPTPVPVIPTPIPVNPNPVPNIPNPNPQPSVTGQMEFAITPFSNMEHGWHVFEPGYRAVCADSQGVVGTAKLSIDAAINGETTDGTGAYQGLIIRPVTQYLRQGATSGNCDLTICLDQNVDQPQAQANCRDVQSVMGGAGERALSFKGSVPYQVNGNTLSLQAGAPGLSAWHPAYGFAAPAKSFKDYQSPLVLDVNGDGQLALTDVWDKKSVRFDMALEGREYPTGWVQKQDGFLVYDRNGNGVIDNASEMFGEYTDAKVLGPKTYKTGFEALAIFDSNKDGLIDQKDAEFNKLTVWIDRNQNGETDKNELKSLASLKIVSIALAAKDLKNGDGTFPMNAGNEVRYSGTFTKRNGKTYQIADVWFKQRRHADQETAMVQWLMATPKK